MFINLFTNLTKRDGSLGCFNATDRIRKLEIHQIKVLVYDRYSLKFYAYFACRFEELEIIVPKAILVSRALVMANSDDALGCFNVTHGLREFEIHQIKIIVYYHN